MKYKLKKEGHAENGSYAILNPSSSTRILHKEKSLGFHPKKASSAVGHFSNFKLIWLALSRFSLK